MTPNFLSLRYRHTSKKKIRNKETWLEEKLEHSADDWATEFVQTSLRPQLTSWLQKLESLFPEELPFGTSRVGRSRFTTMAVMENYQSTPHMDMDLSNSVILWFLEGKCSLPHLSVFDTSSFVKEKKMIA